MREVYEKLKPYLSLEFANITKTRPQRCVVVDGLQMCIRWCPYGVNRPTFEQFLTAYNLEDDGR